MAECWRDSIECKMIIKDDVFTKGTKFYSRLNNPAQKKYLSFFVDRLIKDLASYKR